jgi:hypothetical protein
MKESLYNVALINSEFSLQNDSILTHEKNKLVYNRNH